MQVCQNEIGKPLRLAGALDIGAADELRAALADCIRRDALSAVDLSEVEECDTSAIQILFSARKTARQLGRQFRLSAVSAAVVATADALGLPILELAQDSPAEDLPCADATNRGNEGAD